MLGIYFWDSLYRCWNIYFGNNYHFLLELDRRPVFDSLLLGQFVLIFCFWAEFILVDFVFASITAFCSFESDRDGLLEVTSSFTSSFGIPFCLLFPFFTLVNRSTCFFDALTLAVLVALAGTTFPLSFSSVLDLLPSFSCLSVLVAVVWLLLLDEVFDFSL